ncbi:MAG: hypothetical protein AABX31_03055 [Nanoarchaeota archaeon]
MKIAVILVVTLLLLSGFIIAGCAGQQEISEPSSLSEASDEEILAQYPDDLDAALEELETIG